MFTTLFMLVFGDYANMHKQAITPLLEQDPEKTPIRLWLNAVCLETFEWLLKHAPKSWLVYVSSQNPPKYPVMRKLFNDPQNPIVTPWVTWLDDDTRIVQTDWLAKTTEFIETTPDIVFFGAQYWKTHLAGVQAWIRQAAWYSGRPFMRANASQGPNCGKLGIAFLRGSYWWLKTDILRKLDWPDPRLNHNGGDTALSEAVWQTRLLQRQFAYGIDKELAPRRGRSEKPAGFRNRHINPTDNQVPSMLGKLQLYESRLEQAGVPFVRLNAFTLLWGSSAEYSDAEWLEPAKDIRQPDKAIARRVVSRKKSKQKKRRQPFTNRRAKAAATKKAKLDTAAVVAVAEGAEVPKKTIRARLLERLRRKREQGIHNEKQRIQRVQRRDDIARRHDSRA